MENLDISKIEEYEEKLVLEYKYFNGLHRPCNGGLFVTEDKGLYDYTIFHASYDKGNSYFRKIKDLSDKEYRKVLFLIRWKIGNKKFESIQSTDGGSTIVINYKNINREISYCLKLSEMVYKFLDGLKKQ